MKVDVVMLNTVKNYEESDSKPVSQSADQSASQSVSQSVS